jgi:hypothetical protein
MVLVLAIATMVLGNLVRTLFQKNTNLESRLNAIEKVEGPFERALADAGPAPLKRVLTLNVQVYAKFWKDVLQLTPAQVEQIKMHVHNLKKEASEKLFDEHFFEVWIRIEEWRGGYTHFEVAYPRSPLEKPKSSSVYGGNRDERFWQFEIPPQEGESPTGGLAPFPGMLWLETKGELVTLHATGGRFGWASFSETKPAPDNIFLAVPLSEGPRAERYFKPALSFEYAPGCYRHLQPWERCYQHLDVQKGLGWELWIGDCDLRTRAKWNERKALDQMLADWRERFAWNDEGKAWHERVAKAVEDPYGQERAKLDPRAGGPQEDAAPTAGPP